MHKEGFTAESFTHTVELVMTRPRPSVSAGGPSRGPAALGHACPLLSPFLGTGSARVTAARRRAGSQERQPRGWHGVRRFSGGPGLRAPRGRALEPRGEATSGATPVSAPASRKFPGHPRGHSLGHGGDGGGGKAGLEQADPKHRERTRTTRDGVPISLEALAAAFQRWPIGRMGRSLDGTSLVRPGACWTT